MTPGARLRENLRKVGEVKVASGDEDLAAYLALSPGERLERVVRQSSTLLCLSREAGKTVRTEDDDVWLRVYQRLHRPARDG